MKGAYQAVSAGATSVEEAMIVTEASAKAGVVPEVNPLEAIIRESNDKKREAGSFKRCGSIVSMD